MNILHRLNSIYKRISHAAMRADRNPEDVRLVAVSKTVPMGPILEALDAGQRLFGESRVQETATKAAPMVEHHAILHMIGHLQKNKVRRAVELFDVIETVDSVELLRSIDTAAGACNKRQRVFLQVKLSGELSKSGASETELRQMLIAAAGMRNVLVEGLMTIPPYFDDTELSRPYYRQLAELARDFGLCALSMGMSHDFEVAIEEGATLVRVGTAIFGARATQEAIAEESETEDESEPVNSEHSPDARRAQR